MIRFTSTELRPLLTQNQGKGRPLILEKNLGIYVRVPDDNGCAEWLKAWAAGCNPSRDADWSALCDALIPGPAFSFSTFLDQRIYDAVLNEHHDLFMQPGINQIAKSLTIYKETQPPLKEYLPVADYRHHIQWLYDQSRLHLRACVSNAERLGWRTQALNVLDRVIRVDSKRAKPEDRKWFDSAVRRVKSDIESLKSDGSFRHY
ncbi:MULTISPECIES: hypothetical protein [Pantoea]|uniref:hypothetical protein n=1 Tax=Pantoea TaxID=53335 RepID=UPI0011A22839|nr:MULTISPECIES: hypothetical protein [Pantoea]TWD39086.1 hypothetical protein FBY13_107243 [Pantoea sp. SJZ147]